jgi:NADH-quinone oxidoreductase subunit I
MKIDQFRDRNCGGYIYFNNEIEPTTTSGRFWRTFKRSIKLELFVGLWIVLWEMLKGRRNCHTTEYPLQKMPFNNRYRAVHRLLRLLESGEERCIGCGLCEKICVANCIRMQTKPDENGRKHVSQYTINFGRCVYCGLCAEVCPELAIVHGGGYEHASEQRSLYSLKEDILTPIDRFKAGAQEEFGGYGSPSPDADERIKKTPLIY